MVLECRSGEKLSSLRLGFMMLCRQKIVTAYILMCQQIVLQQDIDSPPAPIRFCHSILIVSKEAGLHWALWLDRIPLSKDPR